MIDLIVTSVQLQNLGSESSTLVEIDVYIWHYALLVVHDIKEEEVAALMLMFNMQCRHDCRQ